MRSITKLFSLTAILSIAIISCTSDSEMPESNTLEYEGYLLSVSPDRIGTDEDVLFLFPADSLREEVSTISSATFFNIQPEVAGNVSWDNGNVLKFSPVARFDPGTQYAISLKMDKLFRNIPDSLKTLVYRFSTDPLQVRASFANAIQPDPDNKDKVIIDGTVSINGPMNPEKLKKAVTVDYVKKSQPTISWNIPEGSKVANFQIANVLRGEESNVLHWNLKGSEVGADYDLQYNFEIPAKGSFVINDVQLQREGNTQILLNFSEVLERNQDLRGLVRIQGNANAITTDIRDNNLVIYPDANLNGTFQLIVDSGIKSADGGQLGRSYIYDLALEMQPPALRLVGNGVIVPGKKKVIFPFEAINLEKVELEVIKIFDNNTLQFLQYNQLDTDYDLNAVGKAVWNETIDLRKIESDIPMDLWTRYAIDLSSVLNKDPGAVYQIRAGFKKEYSLLPCDEESNVRVRSSTGDEGSFWVYNTDYPGFSYDHYDDPCYPAFYHYGRFIKRNVLASNLGLTVKSNGDKGFRIFTTDLLSAAPVRGAEVTLYNFQQQPIGKATTDGDGMALINADDEVYFVVAKSGNDAAYLRIIDVESLSLSAFDVAGRRVPGNLDGYFYAERAVWRPGDSVYLNFVLDSRQSGIPHDHPVDLTIYDPRGQKNQERVVLNNTGGVYALHFKTASSSPTGNWRAEVTIGDQVFNKMLKIETVVPNRLKVEWNDRDYITSTGDNASLTLSSRWLHGAPASGLKASVEVEFKRSETEWQSRKPGYTFHDPSRGFNMQPVKLFDGALNANGNTKVSFSDIEKTNLSGVMNARLKTRVLEPAGGFSEDYSSFTFLPFNSYVGIKLPTSRWGGKQMQLNTENASSVVVLDQDGKQVANRELHVGLYIAQWHWWWDREDYSLTHFNSADHQNAIRRDTIRTNEKGEATWNYKPLSYETYMVRVCDPVSGHCTGDMFYAGWGGGSEDGNKEAVAQLTFSSDKKEYAKGEKAKLQIPASKGSKALITIERGDTVLSTQWVEANSDNLDFEFQLTAEMVPNVYVHVSLIQAHEQASNDLPLRLYGVIPIVVKDPETLLNPQLAMPDELRPNSSFELKVSEKDGQAMTYTVAIVDEGLLDLTHFKTPNPHNHFYARQSLQVKTWDIFDYVMTNLGGEVNSIFSVGGDGFVEIDPEGKEANRFPPVVKHIGPFTLAAGKSETHRVSLPNYFGSVRTMVVASSKGRYGSAEKTTPVRQPLMLLASLPRVLSPGEVFELPVQLFTMQDGIKNVSLTVETDNILEKIGPSSQTLSFDKMGDKTAFFKMRVTGNPGIAKVRIAATAGSHKASQKVEIQVSNPNPFITKVQDYTAEKSNTLNLPLDFFGEKGSHTATLEVSAIPPINLGRRMAYLIGYPYGCGEQITSKAFAQLYLDEVTELSKEQKDRISSNIQSVIARLNRFQQPGGTFALWPGNSDLSYWVNNYIGHFLLEAKRKGYFVEPAVLRSWTKSQTQLAQQYRNNQPTAYWSNNAWELQQAYRLYTLALSGEPNWAAMNSFRNVSKHNTAGWLLSAAYSAAGKTDISREIAGGLSVDVGTYRDYGQTYGSTTRDRAIIIKAMQEIGMRKEAAGLVRTISKELGSSSWMSTQELAFSFYAIASFLGDEPQKEHKFAISLPDGKTQEVNLNSPMFYLDISHEGWAGQNITFQNLSGDVLFVRTSITAQPKDYENLTDSKHLNIQVKYTDTGGKPIDISRLKRGTDFIASVTVTNPGSIGRNLEEMALSQIFPSGWEIQNSRLNDFGDFLKNDYSEYRDIRDDRIYTFFDLYGNGAKVTYSTMLTATYPGVYFFPDTYCEAMYDKEVFARSAGKWVEVVADADQVQ